MHDETPYKMLHARKSNIHYFRKFGYIAYVLNKQMLVSKFGAKSHEGIFLSYDVNNI